ncbi:DEAD/DEAH box helicase [Shouchella miscanthi]|uniref:AAA domain-containing protein n=1 Tax=Shouchella miscanthi TaxID=2598861 RepID=A0ABU6NP41_9BACI|nr:AAA domain-containing protein [Shouchella miscanthi]MED4129959.1 AAA domain-containing protein [Shouchella miscanthi]
MNKRNDILDAWIMVEQLSEGSMNKKDSSLVPLRTQEEDWHSFFLRFLEKQKVERNITEKGFKKSGLVLYFGIFNFEEVIELLRSQFKIEKSYEEVSKSDKFTFLLSFDNELNFKEDELFFTMSGYVQQYKKFPKNFTGFEDNFKEDLKKRFEEDFNQTMKELFTKYVVSKEHFRYQFVNDVTNSDPNLHSFFIEDLNKAKKKSNQNLDRYFNGFVGSRQNLDSNKESPHFNPSAFESILQPKFYPLGRFPSNPKFALSFMQQVAVNLASNDRNPIRSVNGPPGTGKTTLLKDIFADLVVQQASEIVALSTKRIDGSLTYWKNAKLGVLPHIISEKNIVVASSNNGAVQNIVRELPKNEQISEEFQNQLAEADYFKQLSNSKVKVEGVGKNRALTLEHVEDENWGTFSLEGGASKNMNNVLLHIESIEKNLEDDYQTNEDVYKEFIRLTERLKKERETIQQFCEKVSLFQKVTMDYTEQRAAFNEKEKQKHEALASVEKRERDDMERVEQEMAHLKKKHVSTSIELEDLKNVQAQAERNYEVISTKKPSLFWVEKLLKVPEMNEYMKELTSANDKLNQMTQQQTDLKKRQSKLEKQLHDYEKRVKSAVKRIEESQAELNQWISTEQTILRNLEQQITALREDLVKSDKKVLDFSLSYDQLQKSNPWFFDHFRTLQSELFISALKVRKQFLYENRKNVKKARMIWQKQSDYIAKENGLLILAESWQWINFTIPVISTTFASFGRMFKHLNENTIGNLFIDEAGQALPQASVGAILRSKKVMVVGDPSQIKPVLTLDSPVLSLIGRHYKVNETFVSADASTQTLVDATSQFGFQKDDEEWIGIPLWVHRRSNYPMFTISNEISYNNLMVQGKEGDAAQGKSDWFDSTGNAIDKYVKEQALLLKKLITNRLQDNPDLAEDIYVITPFRNVAFKVARVLDDIDFTKRENGKPVNVGTVHTFQGKEAKIVYFVLGADSTSSGAASWAVSEANIMNVAATRAKEEFYVIGDKDLYGSLGSNVADSTISIIEKYNEKAQQLT